MNTLSWEKEEIIEKGKKSKKTIYYYVVDGKRLEFNNYRPITCNEVLERTESYYSQDSHSIIICRCLTDSWDYGSILAGVIEENDKIIWKLHSMFYYEVFPEYEFNINIDYEFDAYKYKQTMKEIFEDAKEQIFQENFPLKRVVYLFYCENGETHPELFDEETYHDDIIEYWNERLEDYTTSPIYFEDVRNNDFYRIKKGKWEEVAELNWPPRY